MTEELDQRDAGQAPDDCEQRCAELDHKYKLALADYQNLLKQTAKDRVDLALYANEALILELIPAFDNLKLTLQHFPADGDANWRTGLEHVISQFKKAFADNGVLEIVTEGKFDPVTMEAVETAEIDDAAKDETVAETLKGGYRLHEKVIMPARVKVFKHSN